jgi:hypothetical protein
MMADWITAETRSVFNNYKWKNKDSVWRRIIII